MSRAPHPLARHAVSLWLFGVAALGLLRFWMKVREAGDAPLALDVWLWLAGSCACVLVGLFALLRGRR